MTKNASLVQNGADPRLRFGLLFQPRTLILNLDSALVAGRITCVNTVGKMWIERFPTGVFLWVSEQLIELTIDAA